MAEPLTNIQQPGFFSRIQESPSLFLTPGSVRIVGLVGEGKATKTVREDVTRSALNSDELANPISSITLVSSNVVYRYPQSSYAIAKRGSVDLDPTGGNVNGLTFKVTVDGLSQESHTFVGADPVSLADIAIELNGAMANITAEADGDFLLIYSNTAAAFTVDDGTANTALGFLPDSRANAVRWDPAVTDAEFAPQTGDYIVDYERPKVAADYKPQSFFGLRQVAAEYGDSGAYSLTLGAQGAFGNGASIVICRQLDPAEVAAGDTETKAEMVAALTDLEKEDVWVVVPMLPLNDTAAIDDEYMNHVSKMSSRLERKERRCILSVDETTARLTILGGAGTWQGIMETFNVPASSGLEPHRVEVVNPGYCKTTYKGVQYTMNGTYLAACMAGKKADPTYDEAEPHTRKALATVDELILPDLSRSEKNSLTGLGVTVLEAKGGTILVRRNVSADSTSVAKQEPSITAAFDRVAMDLRESLENRFVGTKILPGTTNTAVEAATSTFLERFVAEEVIGAFRNVKATQNSVEPRQYDVTFEAIPIFPFIWGFIDISINIS